jgi:glutamate-ammonia-ligase adenylyltransferase
LLKGSPETLDLVRHAAYALPLTPANLQELVEMKRRIESERIKPEHLMRDVKLGHGGLNDIEWIVHLIEMKYPEQLEAGRTSAMPDRIRALGKQALLNAFEVEALLEARTHLLRVRALIFYQQLKNDLVPENPDRLERLARACGLETANDFLRIHEPIVNWVRRLFIETLERLCP